MDAMKVMLAGCLREDANSYVVQELIAVFPSIIDLINADDQEIRQIKGIGLIKAKQLRAILDFAKAVNTPVVDKRVIIRSPHDVYELVRGGMEFLQQEQFDILGMSTKNHVIFKETVSIGSLNASIVHPRETFRPLIKRACASVILIHNHPSGDAVPSQDDIELTRKLVEGGKLLEIEVLDHIIIGRGCYVSFKEKGLI